MGSGKSTIAKFLAQELDYKIIDTDKQIESNSGKSITELFQISEDYFRSWELIICKSLSRVKHTVISTGGGTVTREECRVILKKLGFVVYLKCNADTIFERTSKRSNRPLLNTDNKKQTIDELLAKRDPIYTQMADFCVNTDDDNIEEISKKIIKAYHE
jgi:shikimate kinase